MAKLPVPGSPPQRTVLVPGARVAHSLRRLLLGSGHGVCLAGTRFLDAVTAAREVLRSRRWRFAGGEESLRPLRLRVLLATGSCGERFSARLLEAGGWDAELARILSRLEEAGLSAGEYARVAVGGFAQEVARVWLAADQAAGASWTRARILAEASRVLDQDPTCRPFQGPVLAAVTGHETAVEARFLRHLPGARLALLWARPVRRAHLERLAALYGPELAATARVVAPPASGATELDLLKRYLLETPEVSADPARPRSRGRDGSVTLEEFAGTGEELEAVADWVASQLRAGRLLTELAVLVPSAEPWLSLVESRLARLPWPEGPFPIYRATPRPLSERPLAGRLLSVLEALAGALPIDSVAAILPGLATGLPLTRSAALRLCQALGTWGGNRVKKLGALEWGERSRHRSAELEASFSAGEGPGPDTRAARGLRDRRWLAGHLEACAPALQAVSELARLSLARATLPELWPAVREFAARWLARDASDQADLALLDGALQPISADASCSLSSGDDAVEAIAAAVAACRTSPERFGAPALFLGTVGAAAGLPFRAVRILGLTEGGFPSSSGGQPTLPAPVAAAVGASFTAFADDPALAELHSLSRVIADTTDEVALSGARTDLQGSDRELAAVMLDAATALGRAGQTASGLADLRSLRAEYTEPERARWLARRLERPADEAAWEDGAAARLTGLPASWTAREAADPTRVLALLEAPSPTPRDGWVGRDEPFPLLPGLAASRPLSPSGLEDLLQCPYRFFLARVLGLEEPGRPAPLHEIGAIEYGDLLHSLAERFFRAHGAAFGERGGSLEEWLQLGARAAGDAFAELTGRYPLAGETVRARQLERLRRDFAAFLELDWAGGSPRAFFDVERALRVVELPPGSAGRALYMTGFIDRLDVERGAVLVRDLKTGRPHPRHGKEAGPDPVRDSQLAVYGLGVGLLAAAWGLPDRVEAAYVYVGQQLERAFREDFALLADAARGWLELAHGLLSSGVFPRTPVKDDCSFCPFSPVCGRAIGPAAAWLLAGRRGAAGAFGQLRGLEPAEEEEP